MSFSEPVRILIVDDEAALITALCEILSGHGFETVGFTDGNAALDELRKSTFELLLADLMMPQLDGIALLRAALRIDKDLVGIIMTGQGTVDTAVEAMKVGAHDYIIKPFRLSAILPILNRAISVRRLRIENAKLEQGLRERTIELEAANKELEAFSYSVSHDLRGPLRAISGFSNMLVEDFAAEVPAEAQRMLRQIDLSSNRMQQMIDDLLRFSRLSRQPLLKRPVSISALVTEVVTELKKEPRNPAVEVRTGELPDSVGDPALLRHVFTNLLSNAFKFTQRSESPRIELGSLEQDGKRVYVIRDNGVGFDMQYAGRLFGVFQRLHTEQEFAGTGVGLSIVQRIIQRHGGQIRAEGKVGEGATFYFSLQ